MATLAEVARLVGGGSGLGPQVALRPMTPEPGHLALLLDSFPS